MVIEVRLFSASLFLTEMSLHTSETLQRHIQSLLAGNAYFTQRTSSYIATNAMKIMAQTQNTLMSPFDPDES